MRPKRASSAANPHDVFITVSGGVAYVGRAPESVKVHIIDYDDLKADFQAAFNSLSAEAQAFYREIEEMPTHLDRELE